MRISRKAKKQRGSALGLLMIFLTGMMILGVGLLSVSNNRAIQAKATVTTDKQFYAAEAAAQLGAQMLMRELKEDDLYLVGGASEPITKIEKDFYDQLEARLEEIYVFLKDEMDSDSKFNGVKTELEPFDTKDLEDYVVLDDTSKIVYLENPIFIISIKSGGRNVVAEVPVSTTVIDDQSGGGGGLLRNIGGYFTGKEGGIYEEANDLYVDYVKVLEKLFASLNQEYKDNLNKYSFPKRTPTYSDRITTDNATDSKFLAEEYINTNGWDAVLGKAGEEVTYPNLKYIKTGNGVVINGIVHCPNLIAVQSSGNATLSENAKFYAPKLENFSCSGGLTINKGAAINPMKIDPSTYGSANEKVIDQNRPTTPTGSSNFYVGGSGFVINCNDNYNAKTNRNDTELNWCRFNTNTDVMIRYNTRGKLTTNSIYYQKANVIISGTASKDNQRVIPQFYASGYINFTGSNPESVAGIFMTISGNMIFNNGNAMNPLPTFTGLFVGNCDGQYGKYNSYAPPPATAQDFDPDTFALIMDGDWLKNAAVSGVGADAKVAVSLKYNKGVTIREGKK